MAGLFSYVFYVDKLSELLPIAIYTRLPENVCEIRIRTNKAVRLFNGKTWEYLHEENGETLKANKNDIDFILSKASMYSVYAITDAMVRGYITWKYGIRIGVFGEGVFEGGKITNIKNPSSLCIRVPKEVRVDEKLSEKLIHNHIIRNTLIISRPGAGKTTMLRDFARIISNFGKNIVIIDERNEISGTYHGVPQFDIGENSDVILNIPKIKGVEMAVRAMNPDVIATDEFFGEDEVFAILDAIRSGVKVFATMHADNVESIKDTIYEKLLERFELIIFLSDKGVGKVQKIIEKC